MTQAIYEAGFGQRRDETVGETLGMNPRRNTGLAGRGSGLAAR